MPGGGSTPQPTQQTKVEMSPQQRWLFDLARPGIRDFAASVPQRYPGSLIAGFDPLQWSGQNMALGAAGTQQDLLKGAFDANKFLTGAIWDPKSNPALQGAINAAIRPVTEQYREQVLPSIGDTFQQAGQQFGGSRRGVAEGIASGKYLDTVGDTASKLVQDQYGNNLNAFVRGTALAPTTAQSLLIPAQTVSGIGDIRQRLAQALLGEKGQNFNYDQYAPYLQSKDLLSLISGIPGGTTTSTANNPPQAPWWQQALGMGMMGSSIFSNLGGPAAMSGGMSSLASLLPFLAL